MFTNVTFIEQVILLVLLITWGIMKAVMGKAALMSKGYHLVKSLFLVFFIAFVFPIFVWASSFWNQNKNLKDNGNDDRSYLGYYFNWVMIFFWYIVTGFLLYSLAKTAMDPLDGDETIKANYENPDFVHERNELTDAESKI